MAEVWTETRLLSFGDPAARPFMLQGFSVPERPGVLPFTWGTGRFSEIGFDVVQPRPLTLTLQCFPFTFPGAPEEQRATLLLNGRRLAQLPLVPGSHAYTFHLDPDWLVAGRNRLGLEPSYTGRPADVLPGSVDFRDISVAWESLRLAETSSFGQPRTRETTPPVLVLPYRTQVDYTLELREPAHFTVDKVLPWGGASKLRNPGVLEVRAQGLDGKTWRLTLPPSGDGPRSLTLPLGKEGPARVSLRAVPGRETPPQEEAGLQLVLPSLRFPLPEAEGREDESALADCRSPRLPNIVFYMVDTLRADHLGVYGYGRPTSPSIDAFAQEATLFTRAMAQAPYTRPAVSSIFSGLQARAHGVNSIEAALPDSAVTLAELLRRKGYETMGIVTNDNVAPLFGFAQGFDSYRHHAMDVESTDVFLLSDRLNEEAFAWLGRRRGDRPFFLYLHSSDPHAPYTPRSPYRKRFAPEVDPAVGQREMMQALGQGQIPFAPKMRDELVALYDAEIAFNDAQFGVLLRKLEELGLAESTLVIFTSDHGEEFYEHGGWEHASNLHAEQLHIPLIIKLPGGHGAGRRVTALVQQVDLLPTILAAVGSEPPQAIDGVSLLPAICSGAPPRPRRVFSHLGVGRRADSVTTDRWKLIWKLDNPGQVASRLELFDLFTDRQEIRNRAEQQPVWSAFLKGLLRSNLAMLKPLQGGTNVQIDPVLERRLRALGYID